jgi:hypothetical protein
VNHRQRVVSRRVWHSAQIEKPQQRRDAAVAEPAAPRIFDPAYDRYGS